MAKEMIAILLADDQGSRLYALIQRLAKPAVPLGGRYRIIGFPLSNYVNSGIDTMSILTQYQPLALSEYISNGQPWDLDRLYDGVHVLPSYQRVSSSDWCKGTASVIYQSISFIERYDPQYVIILSENQICKQDYSGFLRFHKEKGAKFSVAIMEVPWEDASRLGLMVADEDSRITGFQEKPKNPRSSLVSVSTYISNWDVLGQYLIEDEADPDSENGLGSNIIPNLLRDGRRMYAYHFSGYWKDVGTISSLWEADMEALDPEHSGISLFDGNWKIYSRNSGMTGYKISGDALVGNSMIANRYHVNGQVKHSVFFSDMKVEARAQVEDAMVMDGTAIRTGAMVKHCVIAENVVIGESTVVGAVPSDGEKGVATIRPGIEIGPDAKVSPSAIVKNNVKGGEEQW